MLIHTQLGVHFHPVGWRTLLNGLYLFTIYALRCQLALRYLVNYLGIPISNDLGFTDFAP
nr:MAG TPA: hypothetical protein [Caudoviricetes sp.]